MYTLLGNLVHQKKTRDIRSLESLLAESGFFPPTHRFANGLLSLGGTATAKNETRQRWYANALQAVDSCSLVFLDPDDGLPPPGKSPLQKRGPKYAFYHEIAGFLLRGQSVITIQYPAHEDEDKLYARYIEPLKLYCSTGLEPTVLRFRIIKYPRFIILSQPDHGHGIGLAVASILDKHPRLFEQVRGPGAGTPSEPALATDHAANRSQRHG